MDYPKYQISKFHGTNRSLQSVFRTNDKAEYDAQLKEWQDITDALPETEMSREVEEKTSHYCSMHNKDMTERVSKRTNKTYWDHRQKVGEKWQVCFGRGWQE